MRPNSALVAITRGVSSSWQSSDSVADARAPDENVKKTRGDWTNPATSRENIEFLSLRYGVGDAAFFAAFFAVFFTAFFVAAFFAAFLAAFLGAAFFTAFFAAFFLAT